MTEDYYQLILLTSHVEYLDRYLISQVGLSLDPAHLPSMHHTAYDSLISSLILSFLVHEYFSHQNAFETPKMVSSE